MQTRINGGLSNGIGDGYLTAAISFALGTLILFVCVLFSKRARTGIELVKAELRSGHMPWWTLTGGLCGVFFVLSQGLIATVIGLALFTVGVVAGQVGGGLVFDRIGLGPGGRVDPTVPRVIGTVLAIVAVALSVIADLAGPSSHATQLWLIVVPLVAGMLVAWQSAVNGLVRSAARSALAPNFINFLLGTIFLVVIAAVSIAINGWPAEWPTNPVLYVGGALGTIAIGLATLLVRTAGVLLLSMSNVAGQLIAAVAVEAWLPLSNGVTVWLVGGTAVGLLAVAIAAMPGRKIGTESAQQASASKH